MTIKKKKNELIIILNNYFLPDISKAFLMAPLFSNFLTQIPLNGSLP